MPILEAYEDKRPQIDPTAFVHDTAVLIGDVRIGPRSSVWPNTTLRGDDGPIIIGEGTSIQDGTVIHATQDMSHTVVGDFCTIGHKVVLHGARIGDHTLVGMGSVVLDNAVIGDYCLIGAASLVTMRREIPDGSFVLGSPAQVVRAIADEEREWIEYAWQRYVEQAERYNRARRNP